MQAARDHLAGGGRIEVLNREGFLMERHVVPLHVEELPWWVRLSSVPWWIGGAAAAQGLARLLFGHREVGLIFLLTGLIIMVLSLVPAALRRHRTARADRPAASPD